MEPFISKKPNYKRNMFQYITMLKCTSNTTTVLKWNMYTDWSQRYSYQTPMTIQWLGIKITSKQTIAFQTCIEPHSLKTYKKHTTINFNTGQLVTHLDLMKKYQSNCMKQSQINTFEHSTVLLMRSNIQVILKTPF